MRALSLLVATSCVGVNFGDSTTEAGGGGSFPSSVGAGGVGAGGAPAGGATAGGASSAGGAPPTGDCLPTLLREGFDSPDWPAGSPLGTQGHPGLFDPRSPRRGVGAWRVVTEASLENDSNKHVSVVRSKDDAVVGGEYWFAISLRDDGVVSNSWSNLRLQCGSFPAGLDTFFVLETKPTEPFAVWGDYLDHVGQGLTPLDLSPGPSGYLDLWLHFSLEGDAGTFVELWANGTLVFEATGSFPNLDCTDLGLRVGIERNPEPFDDTLTVDEAVLLRVDTLPTPFTLDDVFFTLTPESGCVD